MESVGAVSPVRKSCAPAERVSSRFPFNSISENDCAAVFRRNRVYRIYCCARISQKSKARSLPVANDKPYRRAVFAKVQLRDIRGVAALKLQLFVNRPIRAVVDLGYPLDPYAGIRARCYRLIHRAAVLRIYIVKNELRRGICTVDVKRAVIVDSAVGIFRRAEVYSSPNVDSARHRQIVSVQVKHSAFADRRVSVDGNAAVHGKRAVDEQT